MNNFEKIKSMNMDEMIDFIDRLRTPSCSYEEHYFDCDGCFIKELCDLSMSKTKQWLESEVRE